MKTTAYIITCKTNMHAGKGSADQGVIDNLVQRDHTEELPCIYASSLKGALREYFEEYIYRQPGSTLTQDIVFDIFGGGKSIEVKENGKPAYENRKGKYIFHDALLLSIPARSNNYDFFHATCPMVLKRLQMTLKLFNMEHIQLNAFLSDPKNTSIEEEKPVIYGLKSESALQVEHFSNFLYEAENPLDKLFDKAFMIVSDDQFKFMNEDYNLPVVARNQLENGESKNLFYEQIIPRESKFFFMTNSTMTNGTPFESQLAKHVVNMPVQIGANASIGYGYSVITVLDINQ